MMRGLWLEPTITDNEEYLRMYGEAANCCSCGVCEMFACPMGLSPRKVNDYFKAEFRKRGIQVPKNPEAHAREFVQERKTPTNRLVARLNLSQYYGKHPKHMRGTEQWIPYLSRSLSTSGEPAVSSESRPGRPWQRESCIAAAAEGALSANIHSSVDGVIEEITDKGARITMQKGVSI